MQPLREGRRPLSEQAKERGEPMPVGKSIAWLREAGWDCDDDWPDYGCIVESAESPTGYAVAFNPVFALAY